MIEKNSNIVSIIVPVYNVREYLPKCADSLIEQTYRDLDIIFVDDGSTDGSGEICDVYAEKDNRIRVFHTQNGGVSSARNLGLDNIKGSWCAFVDSDDWIEPNMISALLKETESTDADFVECGVIDEYSDCTKERRLVENRTVIKGENLLKANVVDKSIENYVWNKIFKSELFRHIRFLPGRYFEDIEIMHRLVEISETVVVLPECYYHYRYREGAITKTFRLKNLFDLWKTYYERYETYCGKDAEMDKALMEPCIHAAGTIWVWTRSSDPVERRSYIGEYEEIRKFINENYSRITSYKYDKALRLKAFFSRYNEEWAFFIMAMIGKINRKRKSFRHREKLM